MCPGQIFGHFLDYICEACSNLPSSEGLQEMVHFASVERRTAAHVQLNCLGCSVIVRGVGPAALPAHSDYNWRWYHTFASEDLNGHLISTSTASAMLVAMQTAQTSLWLVMTRGTAVRFSGQQCILNADLRHSRACPCQISRKIDAPPFLHLDAWIFQLL